MSAVSSFEIASDQQLSVREGLLQLATDIFRDEPLTVFKPGNGMGWYTRGNSPVWLKMTVDSFDDRQQAVTRARLEIGKPYDQGITAALDADDAWYGHQFDSDFLSICRSALALHDHVPCERIIRTRRIKEAGRQALTIIDKRHGRKT